MIEAQKIIVEFQQQLLTKLRHSKSILLSLLETQVYSNFRIHTH